MPGRNFLPLRLVLFGRGFLFAWIDMPTGSPKYETPEKLQEAINSYQAECLAEDRPLTISGLAYHLGFESRQSFYDYEKREAFSYTIKRARLFIENSYEERLSGNNATGSIFALKNFGWKDKQETELSTKDDKPIMLWGGKSE